MSSFCPFRPSTFAHAARLKRLAAAKEKELAKCEFILFVHFEFYAL
jgi:hypothetical protein